LKLGFLAFGFWKEREVVAASKGKELAERSDGV
jgi:hypothetical protein